MKTKNYELIERRNSVFLVIITVFASAVLISSNFFSTRMVSSIRAYIHGESQYSKGQKDASRYLVLYIQTEDSTYYSKFKREIRVPLGDKIAYDGLQNGAGNDEIAQGFLAGKNSPEDVQNMIWLFKNFKDVSFMATPIDIWGKANERVVALLNLGAKVEELIKGGGISPEDKESFLSEIDELSSELTVLESDFSKNLGVSARRITDALFWINLGVVTIILSVVGILTRLMLRRLEKSAKTLESLNRDLVETNEKLDHFLYASSHDLKSPINNLEGLVNLWQILPEENSSAKKEVSEKMALSIKTLKRTIVGIENLMRIDRHDKGDVGLISFEKLVDEVLIENELSFKVDEIELKRDFKVGAVLYSRLELKSILYNLVSNAVKYRDPSRPLQISISTKEQDGYAVLKLGDNGLGMDVEQVGDKLFAMFKRFHNNIPGAGLGLYSVKQIVDRNQGRIEVSSRINEGTTFTVWFKNNRSED